MTVDPTDPYAVLGTTREATPQQIGRAYRSRLRTTHPDTLIAGDPRADATLTHVIAAYATLSDPARRAEYDQRTTPSIGPIPIRVRVTQHPRPRASRPSPIRASPVRWHEI